MAKIKLKLQEIQSLDIELNGYKNPDTNETLIIGLLNEKIKLITKYWLTSLNDSIKNEIIIINDLRNELIKKYGIEDENGVVGIAIEINNQLNPNYIQFQNEINKLFDEEKEIESINLKLEDISDIEINYNTPILFKFIKHE